MRVISGIRRGHKLRAPKGLKVRPTEDRVKESVFNILGKIPEDTLALDLFAGSGSIGIEFLSRGAKKVYFIDSSNDSIGAIKDNLEHTRFTEAGEVLRGNSISYIKRLFTRGLKFDYIYIDPPFEDIKLMEDAMEAISNYPILSDEGIVILERVHEFDLKGELELIDSREYGKKFIGFYRLRSEE